MDIEHFEMIGGMVLFTAVLILAIQFQVSLMEGISEVSGTWVTGEGSKAAASFHIASQGERLGKLRQAQVNTMGGSAYSGCTASFPGLEDSEPLRYNWEALNYCGDLNPEVVRLDLPLRIDVGEGQSDFRILQIGGAS
ncbi:MAG: hypothetical protein H8Z69_03030 [Nanohaloarchaea archaeon]|nr:hypothetical protein [Candidatus Nanohaloarchaea archaeon]